MISGEIPGCYETAGDNQLYIQYIFFNLSIVAPKSDNIKSTSVSAAMD